MTPEELDRVKLSLRRMHLVVQEIWTEKQLLRNLIIDSGWMAQRDLDLGLESGKLLPENRRQVEEHFAMSEQALAELGLDEWLEWFDKMYPRSE